MGPDFCLLGHRPGIVLRTRTECAASTSWSPAQASVKAGFLEGPPKGTSGRLPRMGGIQGPAAETERA